MLKTSPLLLAPRLSLQALVGYDEKKGAPLGALSAS